ncbi:MAG: Hsp20/alpha crystallin family protein [Chitinophagaceae bacterium]|nr:Hsp20/alpha crystallin family protein [Chitinophagaceae bacterium]
MSTKSLVKTTGRFPSVFDDFFKPWNEWFTNGGGMLSKPLTVPAVNVIENHDEYKLSLAAPGMKKSDFEIDVEGNMLTISSEKEEKKEDKDEQYTRREYSYSSFSRSFSLPEDVKQDKIEAAYEDGILKISLPKKEEAKGKTISKHIAIK